MTASTGYLHSVSNRRSNYNISNASTVSDAELLTLVQHAVKHTPTAFNCQLWDAIFDAYLPQLLGDAAREQRTKDRFETAFKAGYGTVVFFEDEEVINAAGQRSPAFAKLFPIWSQNSTGMLQHVIWTALSDIGLGANLQHYGQTAPDIEDVIRKHLEIPESWTSTALMPFGKPIGPAGGWGPKTYLPIEERVKLVK